MEKTEQGEDRRFDGGIFSSQSRAEEANAAGPAGIEANASAGQRSIGGGAGPSEGRQPGFGNRPAETGPGNGRPGEIIRRPMQNMAAYNNVANKNGSGNDGNRNGGYPGYAGPGSGNQGAGWQDAAGPRGGNQDGGYPGYAGPRGGNQDSGYPGHVGPGDGNQGAGWQDAAGPRGGNQGVGWQDAAGPGNGYRKDAWQGNICFGENCRNFAGGGFHYGNGCNGGSVDGSRGYVGCGDYSAGRNRMPNPSVQNHKQKGLCPYGYGECPGNKQPGQTALLLGAGLLMGILFLAFLVTMFFLLCVAVNQKAAEEKRVISQPYGAEGVEEPFAREGAEDTVPTPDWPDKAEEENGNNNNGEYYGEIRDALRTDLPYSIQWENYEYAGNGDTVMIAIDYPVISGDVPNREVLNDVIANEVDYFEEYYEEYSKYMMPEEVFAVYSEGFVTYMDEEVMSVVFSEKIYTDYWVDCGLFCVNIDMENGVVLDNGSILDVDDAFAVDFRTRSRKQNGSISALEYLTDQEVAYYLTNGSTGIIFFTPLGMEIGLNYGEDYVTVTYKDYKEFLLKY